MRIDRHIRKENLMAPRLEPPICGPKADKENWGEYHDTHHFIRDGDKDRCLWCGTRFFTSLPVSNGYLAMAHEPRAIMQMAEHLELVDSCEQAGGSCGSQGQTAIHRQMGTSHQRRRQMGALGNIGMVLLDGIAKPKERLDGWQPASLFHKIQCSFAASADCY